MWVVLSQDLSESRGQCSPSACAGIGLPATQRCPSPFPQFPPFPPCLQPPSSCARQPCRRPRPSLMPKKGSGTQALGICLARPSPSFTDKNTRSQEAPPRKAQAPARGRLKGWALGCFSNVHALALGTLELGAQKPPKSCPASQELGVQLPRPGGAGLDQMRPRAPQWPHCHVLLVGEGLEGATQCS